MNLLFFSSLLSGRKILWDNGTISKWGSFVLCMTKFRTWIAAGAMQLHRPYPADDRNRKVTVHKSFSAPL